jgi:hypothetical protein
MKLVEMVAPDRELLDEFFEHPVSQELIVLMNARLAIAESSRENCYIPGNPYQTAENHAQLNGAVEELALIVEALSEQDLEILEIPEEDEVDWSEIGNE